MPQADDHHSKRDRLRAFDVLSARLTQIEGVLTVLRCAYDDDNEEFTPASSHIHNALWAVDELLQEAEAARRTIAKTEPPSEERDGPKLPDNVIAMIPKGWRDSFGYQMAVEKSRTIAEQKPEE